MYVKYIAIYDLKRFWDIKPISQRHWHLQILRWWQTLFLSKLQGKFTFMIVTKCYIVNFTPSSLWHSSIWHQSFFVKENGLWRATKKKLVESSSVSFILLQISIDVCLKSTAGCLATNYFLLLNAKRQWRALRPFVCSNDGVGYSPHEHKINHKIYKEYMSTKMQKLKLYKQYIEILSNNTTLVIKQKYRNSKLIFQCKINGIQQSSWL